MRIERWFWLPIFCVVSMLMHLGVAIVAHGSGTSVTAPPAAPSIEVAFEPVAAPRQPKIVQVPAPPKPKPTLKPPTRVIRGPRLAVAPRVRIRNVYRERPARVRLAADPEIVGAKPIPAPAVKPVSVPVELPEQIKAETPDTRQTAAATVVTPPKLHRVNREQTLTEGGGSPSPALVPGGRGGLNAPENPKEDLLFTGGGRGGANLPNAAPTTGGGGGVSILHVKGDNPLGAGIPEDKPGLGPGTGGGQGTGAKGGIGFATGKGIGTQPDGKVAIGSLRRAKGPGIGAAVAGSEVGTKPPGGGRGLGSELPGIGGTGTGYGRGRGIHLGDGTVDSSAPMRPRGVPFGNIAGLLGGGTPRPGGPGIPIGGPVRGAVFGTRQAGGTSAPIHIVYALDVSGSMREKGKIYKATEALKIALGELRRSDTFNIVLFCKESYTFQPDSVPATLANVANARNFVDHLSMGDGTNISEAMDIALGMNGITQIYLMSDGEPNLSRGEDGKPNGSIVDFAELRRFIRAKNSRNIKIATLALGIGEDFPGIILLKGIAEDNHGTYDYIDMTKIPRHFERGN